MITDKQRKLWSDENARLADEGELLAYCERKGLRNLKYDDRAGRTARFDLAPADP